MPNYFPENDTALPTDSSERSMAKVVSQLPAALDVIGLEPETAVYVARSGATDVAAIDAFVKGVKELGLWNSMVCWPLRRSQNSGGVNPNSNIVYSLGGLGTFNGTLTNGPTWTSSGISYSGAAFSPRISAPLSLATPMLAGGSVFGVVQTISEDNFAVFIAEATLGTPTASSLILNLQSSTGVVPVVTRGNPAVRYFQSSRGGAWASGFNSAAAVIRDTSQQNFRNGSSIANETGLSAINTTGTIDIVSVGRRGNGSVPMSAHSFTLVSSQQFSDTQVAALHSLYKTTLGTGLGLP